MAGRSSSFPRGAVLTAYLKGRRGMLSEFAEQGEEGLAASLYLDRPHLKAARRAS